jgi:hypothetical protein
MNSRLDAHPVRRLLTCVVFAFACASCHTTRSATEPSPQVAPPIEPAVRAADSEPTPDWVGQTLSWDKLRAIETWLAAASAESHGFWYVEGELQLAQGRFELARREQNGKGANTAQITTRVRAARAGFERVAKDPAATEGQQQRARSLIASADKVLGGKRATNANAPLGQLGVVTRAAWRASAPRTERMEKNKGGWKRITVHHSAEENAPSLDGSIADTADALRLMQKSHMESKSPRWGDIGYHFLIDPAGHIFQGRDLAWQGAHADGDNNVQNIGICLIGNFDEERPTRAALESLRRLLDSLRSQNSIPSSAVYGHQDLKSTRCPGRYLEPWVKNYAH